MCFYLYYLKFRIQTCFHEVLIQWFSMISMSFKWIVTGLLKIEKKTSGGRARENSFEMTTILVNKNKFHRFCELLSS